MALTNQRQPGPVMARRERGRSMDRRGGETCYKSSQARCQPAKRKTMRPSILFPRFAAVTTLPGVGPRLGKLFERLAGPHVVDLCWHLPTGLIDRRFAPKVADAPDG